jgi:hypothetical protein
MTNSSQENNRSEGIEATLSSAKPMHVTTRSKHQESKSDARNLSPCERFFYDYKDCAIIDRCNPDTESEIHYFDYQPEQFDMRKILLLNRLRRLAEDFIINRDPPQTDWRGESWLPASDQAGGLAASLFNAIIASALNTVDPSQGMQLRFNGQLKRDNANLRDVTSLSLFCEDVEKVLRDLYGDVNDKMLADLLNAVSVIATQFVKSARNELWQEHNNARDWGCLYIEDARRYAALEELKGRVRDVTEDPAKHSKYTVEFARLFEESMVTDDAEREDMAAVEFARLFEEIVVMDDAEREDMAGGV